jgi:hypothetical protein
MTLSHMRALVVSQVIFAKPGRLPFIYQHGSNNYYKHIVTAPSLVRVATLTEADLDHMTQAAFDAFLKDGILHGALGAGAPAPPVPPPVPDDGPGDGDAYVVAEDPDEIFGAVGVAAHALPPAPPEMAPPVAAVAALMPHVPPAHPPIHLNLEGFPTCHVNFDNITHVSGNARALFQGDCHGVCRMDVFLKDFGGSPERAAAYLFAWYYFGMGCDSKDEHLIRKPSQEEVDVIFDMRFN